MEAIIGFIVVLVIVGVVVTFTIINNKNTKIVKENSRLYKQINITNQKYKFYNTGINTIKFSPCLKSKRALDNLNLSQYVLSEINNSLNYYRNLFENLDKNKTDFSKYIAEYKSIEKYTMQDEFNKMNLQKIKFKTFVSYENRLYKKMQLQEPQTSVTASCHATYTSPSGRNHYWKDASFSYLNLKNYVNLIDENEKQRIYNLELKQKTNEEKREKEKKLRELDKIEKQVLKEKEKLSKDKQEFEQATKGHIYSSQPSESEKATSEIIIEDSDEPYVKLKKLKQMFDNGQITFEEYSNKKKELL